jgi:hypothetical protein
MVAASTASCAQSGSVAATPRRRASSEVGAASVRGEDGWRHRGSGRVSAPGPAGYARSRTPRPLSGSCPSPYRHVKSVGMNVMIAHRLRSRTRLEPRAATSRERCDNRQAAQRDATGSGPDASASTTRMPSRQHTGHNRRGIQGDRDCRGLADGRSAGHRDARGRRSGHQATPTCAGRCEVGIEAAPDRQPKCRSPARTPRPLHRQPAATPPHDRRGPIREEPAARWAVRWSGGAPAA